MRLIHRFALTLTFATACAISTSNTSAAAKMAVKDNALHGKISSVDKDAKTITVGGKAVLVDDTTVITNSGKPAKLDSLKVGTDATVSTFMLGEKLTAVSIKTGVVAVAIPTAKKKK